MGALVDILDIAPTNCAAEPVGRLELRMFKLAVNAPAEVGPQTVVWPGWARLSILMIGAIGTWAGAITLARWAFHAL